MKKRKTCRAGFKTEVVPIFWIPQRAFYRYCVLLKKTIHLIIFDKKPVIFVTANKFACLRTVRIGW